MGDSWDRSGYKVGGGSKKGANGTFCTQLLVNKGIPCWGMLVLMKCLHFSPESAQTARPCDKNYCYCN